MSTDVRQLPKTSIFTVKKTSNKFEQYVALVADGHLGPCSLNETGDTRFGYSTMTSHLVSFQLLNCVNT